MLTRLIVDLYAWIIEISLWFMLLISGVAGYYYTVPILNGAGLILVNEAGWKIYGAVLFAVVTFLVLAVLTGPLLVLFDIRKSVRNLEEKNTGNSNVLMAELREPSL
jgi:energy-coupling factor transporter transmembrane protein EcfT